MARQLSPNKILLLLCGTALTGLLAGHLTSKYAMQMGNIPFDPQPILGSKHAAGTCQIVVFIPSADRNGTPIDQDFWVEVVLTTLAKLFRGATATPRGKGIWRDDEQGGILIREQPVRVFSYAAPEDVTPATLAELKQTLCKMGRETRQGEIGVIIDGTYHGITEFDEE